MSDQKRVITTPKLSMDETVATHCSAHGKKLEYYCQVCQTQCCSDCCIFGGHKGHKVVTHLQMDK